VTTARNQRADPASAARGGRTRTTLAGGTSVPRGGPLLVPPVPRAAAAPGRKPGTGHTATAATAARRATRPPRQGTTTTRSGRPGATTRGQWSSRPIPGGCPPRPPRAAPPVPPHPPVPTAPSAPEPGAVGPRPRPRPT